MRTIVLTLFLISYCVAQSSFGSPLTVSAGVSTTFSFPSCTLEIMLESSATIILDLYVSISSEAELPSGSELLTFSSSVNAGFNLSISPPNVAIGYINFTSPGIDNSDIITGSAEASCFQYDPSLNFYNQLNVDVSSASVFPTITVSLPTPGIFLFVSLDSNAQFPSFYGSGKNLPAGKERSFIYPNGLSLQVTSESSNYLIANFSENVYFPNPSNYISIDAFFTFTAESEDNLNATITYTYDKSEIEAKGIAESTLRIGYYDTTQSSWIFMSSGGSVDTSASVVSQTTTHFSTWGVYGSSGVASIAINFILLASSLLVLLSH